jgi:hypothetical protein
MRTEHNDDDTLALLDGAGVAFMRLTVHRLNAALKEHGVKNAAQREQICSAFLFELAYHLDAGWLVHEDRTLFPKVCFAERAEPGAGENLGRLRLVHVPTDASSWHEYAAGVVSRYFDEDKQSIDGLRRGSYDSED